MKYDYTFPYKSAQITTHLDGHIITWGYNITELMKDMPKAGSLTPQEAEEDISIASLRLALARLNEEIVLEYKQLLTGLNRNDYITELDQLCKRLPQEL